MGVRFNLSFLFAYLILLTWKPCTLLVEVGNIDDDIGNENELRWST